MSDTREYIIDEAYKLFLNHSYEAVSISIISEAIGFTKGALYHHFSSKEELFKAVIDKYFTIPSINVSENISLKDYTEACINHTRKILKGIYSADGKFMPINFISMVADSFRHYEGFSDKQLAFIETEIVSVKKILDNAVKNGEIRNDIDTSIVALQYFSLSFGMAGDIMRNSSIDLAIESLKKQLIQLYNLLKV